MEDETLSFKLLNADETYTAEEQVVMQMEGVLGGIESPYAIHASTVDNISLFQNPVAKDEPIHLQISSTLNRNDARVEIYNTLGVLVRSEQLNQVETELSGFDATGIYTAKVTDNKGNTYFSKLVVR